MNILKYFKLKKINFNYKYTFLTLVIYSSILTLLMLWIQPISISDVLNTFFKSNFMVFFLNFLPILLFTLLFFFITNSLVIPVFFVGLFIIIISFINRFKIILRQDSFKPWDIILGTEAITITGNNTLNTWFFLSIFIILFFALLIFFSFYIKNKKLNIKLRFIYLVATIVIMLLSNKYIFSNHSIHRSLPVFGNQYNQTAISNSKGFLYNFIFTFNTSKITKPENYDKQKIVDIINNYNNYNNADKQQKPHVIMIMSEAYSEIGLSPNIRFDGYTDPMEFFKQLQEESINGNIIVPNIGGGTADTEFDVLTGINTRQFRGAAYSYMLVTKPFKSITSVFNNLGYDNIAIHPGFSWFYNRANVYRYFGFNEFIDITYFDEERYKGMYVNEESTFDYIIDSFDNHLNTSANPFFSFTVTIQNHGPYFDKYLSDTNFSTSLGLSNDDINTLSNYFEGVADQDKELKRLINYLRNLNEPVVLLYFGDHIPALSQDSYSKLIENRNYDEIQLGLYTTPFIIWQNEAAKNIIDFSEYKLQNNTFSSIFLGGFLLELLGYSKLDPFYDNLNHLRNIYPVILENNYLNINMQINPISMAPYEVKTYLDWSYYRTFDEN